MLSKILIFLTCISTYGAEPRAVSILSKKLSPFWAQEYAGIDLVRKEMKSLTNLDKIMVSIFDSGFERDFILSDIDTIIDQAYNGRRRVTAHHGTSVANLINGEVPYGTTDQSIYASLSRVTPSFRYSAVLDELIRTNKLPRVISNSMGWTHSSILDSAKKADSLGTIWVLAGGYQSDSGDRSYEDRAPVINVASYGPSGLMSMSARDFKEIDIFSPADLYQASIDGKGNYTLFGESSGATPLVSGTIVNMLSMVPKLNRSDIEVLLKKSSLPSLNQYIKTESKAGLLNSYKMYRVLSKLKRNCDNVECIKRGIRKEESYTFAISKGRFDHIKAAFPVCSNSKIEIYVDPETALQELRKEIFLNHKDLGLLKLSKCIYKNMGLEKNSEFFHHLIQIQTDYKSRIVEMEKEAILSIQNNLTEITYLRFSHLYSNVFKNALLRAIDGSDESYFYEELYNSLAKSDQ